MFHQVFPETDLWEPLPRKALDVFQKAAMGGVGPEVREERLGECGSGAHSGRVRSSDLAHPATSLLALFMFGDFIGVSS